MAEWFAIPGVAFSELEQVLLMEGDVDTLAKLKDGRASADLRSVGLTVAAMGWSWAVFLAQTGLLSIVETAGLKIQTEMNLDRNPFEASTAMVEGGPPPVVQGLIPLHFEYIDDFGLIHFFKTGEGNHAMVDKLYAAIKEEMIASGLPVHKETVENDSVMLGVSVGGSPPTVRTVPEKRWLSIEVQWELARSGRGLSKVVESIVALTTWIFMVMREGLSIYQEVYTWIRENREDGHLLSLPREVRRELASAAVSVLMVGQDLTLPWSQKVYLFDASGTSSSLTMPIGGGGVCETTASYSEVTAEGKWAIRGGWTKFVGDPDFFTHYRPMELEAATVTIVTEPSQTSIVVLRFLDLYGGFEKDKGLAWYLMRLGAARGVRVVVDSFDAVYGPEFDLTNAEVVKTLVSACRSGKYAGALSGAPTSTWKVRSGQSRRPVGLDSCRTRESPWGLPTNSPKRQALVDLHSTLWRNGMTILEAVNRGGGATVVIQPAATGQYWEASPWHLRSTSEVEKRCHWQRVLFPMCMWGGSEAQYAMSGNVEDIRSLDVHGTGKCLHPTGECRRPVDPGPPVEHWWEKIKPGRYTPELCQKIAEMFLNTWINGKAPHTLEEVVPGRPVGYWDYPEMGDRVPSPEVSGVWDPLERWTETARWVWKKEEHNNILEARAGVVSARIASSRVENWNTRMVIISDSQVTIGVFGKGRSSTTVLNMLARRVAALQMGTGMRFYWRYMRTHRNHADGPSRGFPLGVAPKGEDGENADDTGTSTF